LKAVLQIAQEHPKQAIETYRLLLALIQAQRELQVKNFDQVNFLVSDVRVLQSYAARALNPNDIN